MARTCIPFHVGSGESDRGPRLGGRRPDLRVEFQTPLRYLLSVPLLGEDRMVSVFVNANFDVMASLAGQLLPPGEVVPVVHDSTVGRARDDSPEDSPLDAHALVLDPERIDEMDEVPEEGRRPPWSGHKLGGLPYIVNLGEPLDQQVEAAFGAGFRQVVQCDFPAKAGDELVSGDWPFGNGMFHLLERGGEFRWFYEF